MRRTAPEPKWVRFEPCESPAHRKPRKTGVWRVLSKAAAGELAVLLGEVRWYGAWRCYAFFPNDDLRLVFEQRCLRDIATFLRFQMAERRRARAAA